MVGGLMVPGGFCGGEGELQRVWAGKRAWEVGCLRRYLAGKACAISATGCSFCPCSLPLSPGLCLTDATHSQATSQTKRTLRPDA